MDVSAAIRSAVAVLLRPDDILPAYFLTPAVGTVVRVVPMAGLAVALLYLGATSRLDRTLSLLADRDLEPPPADAEPGAFEAWASQLAPALEPLAAPLVVAIVVATVLASILVFVVVAMAVTAAQLSACHGGLQSRRGMLAAVRGVRRYTLSIFLVRLLEATVWIVTILVALFVLGVAAVLAPLLAALVAVAVVPGAVAVLLVTRALFAFVPVAVVVDDVGVGDAVRGGAGFLAANPSRAIAYYGIAIAGIGSLGFLAAVLAVAGGAPLAAVTGFGLVWPFLDLVKTGLYGGHRGALTPPEPPEANRASRAVVGLRRGCAETAAFVRDTPVLHAIALTIGVAGFAAGWLLADPLADALSTSIASRLEGHRPVAAAVAFGANNWTVAVSTAFGGLALAVPAGAALAFNGAVFGIYGRTEEAPAELLAFVLPHSVFEVPAIVIAGALGIHLGIVSWRTLVGRTDGEALAAELRRAFWVAVGLGVLLAAAAVIEGFVSPYYYRLFL